MACQLASPCRHLAYAYTPWQQLSFWEASPDELAITLDYDIAEAAEYVTAPHELLVATFAYYMLSETTTV